MIMDSPSRNTRSSSKKLQESFATKEDETVSLSEISGLLGGVDRRLSLASDTVSIAGSTMPQDIALATEEPAINEKAEAPATEAVVPRISHQ